MTWSLSAAGHFIDAEAERLFTQGVNALLSSAKEKDAVSSYQLVTSTAGQQGLDDLKTGVVTDVPAVAQVVHGAEAHTPVLPADAPVPSGPTGSPEDLTNASVPESPVPDPVLTPASSAPPENRMLDEVKKMLNDFVDKLREL